MKKFFDGMSALLTDQLLPTGEALAKESDLQYEAEKNAFETLIQSLVRSNSEYFPQNAKIPDAKIVIPVLIDNYRDAAYYKKLITSCMDTLQGQITIPKSLYLIEDQSASSEIGKPYILAKCLIHNVRYGKFLDLKQHKNKKFFTHLCKIITDTDFGISMENLSENQYSGLMQAIESEDNEIIKEIINLPNKIDYCIADENALSLAIQHNCPLEIIKQILELDSNNVLLNPSILLEVICKDPSEPELITLVLHKIIDKKPDLLQRPLNTRGHNALMIALDNNL